MKGEWLEDKGQFSRYAIEGTTDEGESIWVCNECLSDATECEIDPYEDFCENCSLD